MPDVDAFFLPLRQGRRFCLLHSPSRSQRELGAVLFIHAFGDEMNKSRRMATNQARSFADAGWVVLQIDLLGCGDSEGDFGDASWQHWLDDVVDASGWLRAKTGHRPVLWGLRTGCLLVAQVACTTGGFTELVLWQPILSGKQFLQRFLRLKIAHKVLTETKGERAGTQQLREQLARGESLEISGYELSPALAMGMEAADLQLPRGNIRVGWFEVCGSGDCELAPASSLRIKAWRDAGHDVQARGVRGPAFWQTQETSECPSLIESTLAVVQGWRA